MRNFLIPIAHQLLKSDLVYDAYQTCVGSVKYRKRIIENLVTSETLSFLDIGCGTASTLELLPSDARYVGVDFSASYLERANRKRSGLQLLLADVSKETWTKSVFFKDPTICIAMGIFHHLDDDALDLSLQNCLSVLPKGSKIISMDPIITDFSSRGARWFAENDRGKFVRTSQQLEKIFLRNGVTASIHIKRNQMRIPLDTVEISITV
jgi:SAM-dependent methyltransferase